MFPSQGGQTALHLASSKGLRDVVKLLLDGGAQLDIKNVVSTELSTYMYTVFGMDKH